jgi:hypothetical protein
MRAYSPSRGGVAAPVRKGPVPKRRGRGWSLASHVSECILEQWLVSDHYLGIALSRSRFAPAHRARLPAASVASRLFINAAATPPLEEGNAPTANTLVIHSSKTAQLARKSRRPGEVSASAAKNGQPREKMWRPEQRMRNLDKECGT